MLEPLIRSHQAIDRRRFTLLADKAYSHPSTRRLLRKLKISHVIPERRDQVEQRKAKG